LWETWHGGDDGEPLDTFTILTTDANATVAPTHDRDIRPIGIPCSRVSPFSSRALCNSGMSASTDGMRR
jgi:hypothetical protein